jgi:hypothetical protein
VTGGFTVRVGVTGGFIVCVGLMACVGGTVGGLAVPDGRAELDVLLAGGLDVLLAGGPELLHPAMAAASATVAIGP